MTASYSVLIQHIIEQMADEALPPHLQGGGDGRRSGPAPPSARRLSTRPLKISATPPALYFDRLHSNVPTASCLFAMLDRSCIALKSGCALIKLAKSARNSRTGSRMAALFARECDRK